MSSLVKTMDKFRFNDVEKKVKKRFTELLEYETLNTFVVTCHANLWACFRLRGIDIYDQNVALMKHFYCPRLLVFPYKRFKLNQLDYDVRERFIGLLEAEDALKTLNNFMLTSKKNYIKCLEIHGIEVHTANYCTTKVVTVASPRQFNIDFKNNADFEAYLNQSKFRPYMRHVELGIDRKIKLAHTLPVPLLYTKLTLSGLETFDDVDLMKELYYHKDIKKVEIWLNDPDMNKILKIVNYILKKLIVKSYVFRNLQGIDENELHHFSKLIEIPEYVEKISLHWDSNTGIYIKNYKNHKWID